MIDLQAHAADLFKQAGALGELCSDLWERIKPETDPDVRAELLARHDAAHAEHVRVLNGLQALPSDLRPRP